MIGLYDLIQGSKNGELTSKKIEDFLTKKKVSKRNKERILEWAKELEFWEEYAKIYINLEKASPYSNLSKTIEELIKPKKGDICLDVGCGPAKMSQIIWKKSKGRVKKIIGTDIVLKPAKETLKRINHSMPLELIYGNIGQKFPFPDNHFNLIVANLIIPYVIDFKGKRGKEALQAVLEEVYRILKPGGHMVWSTPKKDVHFQWVFLASIPDMLNVYEYIVHKDISRILQGTRILKHALEIQRKGKEGIYSFLAKDELEKMLLKKVGFTNLIWEKTFTQQVWVNRVYKPKVV
jgi:ubiquinone/menaquinone biosynthesis C-methylase UbiE